MKIFTFKYLLILGLGILLPISDFAQETNVDSSERLLLSEQQSPYLKGEASSRISNTYVVKFTNLSDELQISEEELTSLRVRLEAVKNRSKEVAHKDQKELFKENIKALKISEQQLISEVRLIRKALRLLQEHKAEPDPGKMRVLHQIEEIESEIVSLRALSEDSKMDLVLDKMQFDERNVYLEHPPQSCNVVYNGIDANSQKSRKELGKDFLFGYTHPKLKNYFKDEHYLTCDVKLLELDKKKYLWMYITIASKDAIKSYGYIEKNSPLKFELLNGEILYATTAQYSRGRLEAYTGNTLYEIIIPLDKSRFRQFKKAEIDKIGIMWSSGYEQYEVYNVDVLMNQIKCLENL